MHDGDITDSTIKRDLKKRKASPSLIQKAVNVTPKTASLKLEAKVMERIRLQSRIYKSFDGEKYDYPRIVEFGFQIRNYLYRRLAKTLPNVKSSDTKVALALISHLPNKRPFKLFPSIRKLKERTSLSGRQILRSIKNLKKETIIYYAKGKTGRVNHYAIPIIEEFFKEINNIESGHVDVTDDGHVDVTSDGQVDVISDGQVDGTLTIESNSKNKLDKLTSRIFDNPMKESNWDLLIEETEDYQEKGFLGFCREYKIYHENLTENTNQEERNALSYMYNKESPQKALAVLLDMLKRKKHPEADYEHLDSSALNDLCNQFLREVDDKCPEHSNHIQSVTMPGGVLNRGLLTIYQLEGFEVARWTALHFVPGTLP